MRNAYAISDELNSLPNSLSHFKLIVEISIDRHIT